MKKAVAFLSKPLFLLFCSAFLSALPMTFSSLFFLSWFSFIPFFAVMIKSLGRTTFFSALGRGVWFGFFYHFFIYFWFLWLYPLDFTGIGNTTSVLVVLLAWLGISLAHGALFALSTLFCHFVEKKFLSRPLALFSSILGILLAQRIMESSDLAFPWVRVSLGQYRVPFLIQSASLFGIEGLDALILAISALIALALFSNSKKRLTCAFFALLLFSANALFGILRLTVTTSEEKTICVTSVQGCILSGEKWEKSESALETYLRLTRESVTSKTDLVVWPESAVVKNLALHTDLIQKYQDLSREMGAKMITGCFWQIDGITSNSALYLDSDSTLAPYSKRMLVPFGEKMPYRASFRVFFRF